MNACHRGCRLYSICQFVNGNTGINTSKEECQGGTTYFDHFWEVAECSNDINLTTALERSGHSSELVCFDS